MKRLMRFAVFLMVLWIPHAHALSEVGFGGSPAEARQRAAAALVQTIQVQVKAVVEACTQTSGRKAEDCGSRVLRRTAADLPLLGLRYVDVPGEGDRYGAMAVLEPGPAIPLYRRKLADLQTDLVARRAVLEAERQGRVRHDLLTRQVACLRAIADHRLVAVALGDTVDEPAVSEAALIAELSTLEQSVDSIALAARVLLKDIDGRLVNVDPIMPVDSREATPFSAALADALRVEMGTRTGEALFAKGEYRILADGRIDIRLEVLRLPDGSQVAFRTTQLSPAAYAGYRATPLAPNFERLLKEGVVVSSALTVDIITDKGSRDLLFRAADVVRLLVRVNQPAYFYVVGHVVREGSEFSYLLPMDGDPAGDDRPDRFIRYVPPDKANHHQDLGEFDVIAPFGTEHVQVIASTQRPYESIPPTRYDRASGYHVIAGSAGDATRGLTVTRGLRLKVSGKAAVTEATLTFTTMP